MCAKKRERVGSALRKREPKRCRSPSFLPSFLPTPLPLQKEKERRAAREMRPGVQRQRGGVKDIREGVQKKEEVHAAGGAAEVL